MQLTFLDLLEDRITEKKIKVKNSQRGRFFPRRGQIVETVDSVDNFRGRDGLRVREG